MVEGAVTCSLSQACAIFEDHLADIKDACVSNMRYLLSEIDKPIPTHDQDLKWVRDEVYKLRVEQIVAAPAKVVKRIDSIERYKNNPTTQGITDSMIASAKDRSIADMFDTRLYKANRNYVGRCPFHNGGNERTPSFTIYPDNTGHCYGCQWHGDAIAFYMAKTGASFIQAVKQLSI